MGIAKWKPDHKMIQQQKKVAAALFFHEHVVSILKMVMPKANWYDLVDSMPSKYGQIPAASRIRCKDIRALRLTLKWYAFEKLNDSNCDYIENNEWDDSFCDFDP